MQESVVIDEGSESTVCRARGTRFYGYAPSHPSMSSPVFTPPDPLPHRPSSNRELTDDTQFDSSHFGDPQSLWTLWHPTHTAPTTRDSVVSEVRGLSLVWVQVPDSHFFPRSLFFHGFVLRPGSWITLFSPRTWGFSLGLEFLLSPSPSSSTPSIIPPI